MEKTFVEGWRLIRDSISILSAIAPVDVIVVPGNHDVESAFYLGEVLFAYYHNDKNVNIDNSPPVRKYYRYGVNLIGFTHGKDEKIAELPLIMASERSKDFSQTRYREWHLGDKHHKKEYYFLSTNEIKGVTIRILRSLTSADQWHYQKGYIGSVKSAEAFVWDKNNGIVCNLSVNI